MEHKAKKFELSKPVIGDYIDCAGKECKGKKLPLVGIIYQFKCDECGTTGRITLD